MFVGVLNSNVLLFLVIGFGICILSFILCSNRFLSCLMVLENMNVLLLSCCLLVSYWDSRSCFVALLVMFTIEVVVGLVVLTRVWSSGALIGLVLY